MMKSFTPKEKQDYTKRTKREKAPAITGYRPSPMALQIVFGYAAALTVLKTKSLGSISFLLN